MSYSATLNLKLNSVTLMVLLMCNTNLLAQCLPSFPYHDGWLGGDNSISTLLPNGQTVWFFSDSFVAMPGQMSRKEARMVDNTMALSSCKNGEWTIQYFWNRKSENTHTPFFQRPKEGFKYWPAEAFMANGKLYVVLSIIGPKPGATSKDAFNFKHYGVSLAVVENFNDDPSHWNIEYISWENLVSTEWAEGVVYNDYYYVLYSTEARVNHLLRIPLASLESPEGAVEYWSSGLNWKKNVDIKDAAVLFQEQIGGSLYYHAARETWLLINGPHFLTSNIVYRTATEITGPWSEPKTLLETPETTPSSNAYDKTYTSYCAQEHTQFGDQNFLVITYDCNSIHFSRLVKDLSIYNPRVLKIPFPNVMDEK